MSDQLVIAGAALEFVGLTIVFVELATIRSHEFGVPTPWTRVRAWVRRVLKRPQVITVTGAGSSESAGYGRVTARPADLGPDASEAARIQRLERYVEHLDRDVDGLHARIDRTAEEVIAEAAKRDEQLRQEHEAREADRRAQLRSSLTRQAIGGACVGIGLILGTVGSVC